MPLLQKCRALSHTGHWSVDEQIVPYTGTSLLRQCVKNKPNPVSSKNFVLAIPQRLVLDFLSTKVQVHGLPANRNLS